MRTYKTGKSKGMMAISYLLIVLLAMLFACAALEVANDGFAESSRSLEPYEREHAARQLLHFAETWFFDEVRTGRVQPPPLKESAFSASKAPLYNLPDLYIDEFVKNNPHFSVSVYIADKYYEKPAYQPEMAGVVYEPPYFYEDDEAAEKGYVSEKTYQIFVHLTCEDRPGMFFRMTKDIKIVRKNDGKLVKIPLYSKKELLVKDK